MLMRPAMAGHMAIPREAGQARRAGDGRRTILTSGPGSDRTGVLELVDVRRSLSCGVA